VVDGVPGGRASGDVGGAHQRRKQAQRAVISGVWSQRRKASRSAAALQILAEELTAARRARIVAADIAAQQRPA
jgi:hypothetical protein